MTWWWKIFVRYFHRRPHEADIHLVAHQETLARADRLLRLVAGYEKAERARPKRQRRSH